LSVPCALTWPCMEAQHLLWNDEIKKHALIHDLAQSTQPKPARGSVFTQKLSPGAVVYMIHIL
jgi:hypothetical protein